MLNKAIRFTGRANRLFVAKPFNMQTMHFNQQRYFASPILDLTGLAGAMSSIGTDVGSRKINTKTLCDLIGSRYYQHNEEIEMKDDMIVKCFDENDQILGEMTLREAK
jgi:hypothetical protein